jgi:hypothetical protein
MNPAPIPVASTTPRDAFVHTSVLLEIWSRTRSVSYIGQYADAATGLYCTVARYHDPVWKLLTA